MTVAVTGLVLLAALMHAGWNALVKGAADRTVTLGLIALGHVVPAVIVAGFVPPPALAALPYIVASTVIHWGYYVFLNYSYRHGDLSFAYPVARGLAPVLIALGALGLAGEALPALAWIGIGIVSVGILSLASFRAASRHATGFAVATSLTIAAYSVADGIGIRVSGSPLGYVAWLFVAEIFVAAFVLIGWRKRVRATPLRSIALGFLGGVISGGAYALVLYAKTLAPLGVVSALRETSVIFAALIGILVFGERPAGRRLVAAGVVAAGIVVLGLG